MSEIGWQIVDLTWLWTSCAGLALGLLVFHLGLKRSDWAPIIAMATVPIQRTLLIGDGSVHLTFTQCAVAAFFASALILFLGGSLTIRIDLTALLFAAVALWYAISIVAGPDLNNWLSELYRWFVPVSFFIISRSYFGAGSGRRLLGCFMALAGVAGT